MDGKNELKFLINKEIDKQIGKYFTNIDYIKKENNYISQSNKNCSITSELKEFISNPNKFTLTSAFDHKGAKSFLKSKIKALKEITIDDNIISDEENSEKEEDKLTNSKKRIFSCKGITKVRRRNSIIYPREQIVLTNIENRIKSSNNLKKQKSKCEIKKNNDNLLSLAKNNLRVKKKPTKFCSQLELKMYKDKKINKIKPIKSFKSRKNSIYHSFNNLLDLEKSNTLKSDSTLVQLVNEINQNESQY